MLFMVGLVPAMFFMADPYVQADDGIYSGLMPYNQNGVYTVTVNFDNLAGSAYLTAASASHATGPDGEAWTPTTTLVGEAFSASASTQVTISNYQADDHGDTPQTATVVQPDNADAAGRIDRAGDVDVFSVTPAETGTLVVRLGSLALGMRPHGRVLAADGVSVLAAFDVDPQAVPYFFTSLQVQAGQAFFVEISDQDGGASGGLYALSVGKPLPNVWEQPPHLIFLPVVQ